jgi:hypothetical protein
MRQGTQRLIRAANLGNLSLAELGYIPADALHHAVRFAGDQTGCVSQEPPLQRQAA